MKRRTENHEPRTFDPMATRTPHAVAEHPDGAALEHLPPGEAAGRPRAHLRIDRRACRLLDIDNFAGGCKALIDALKEAQLIPDDDPASLEVSFVQTRVRTRKEEGTHLTLTQG